MKQCFSTHHNGQSDSMAEWCFSTSRQHPTIGETGEKSRAETVFLVVRSRKHRMDGRGAQCISLRDNREKNHAQRFSRTSLFGSRATGIADRDRTLRNLGRAMPSRGGPGAPLDQEANSRQRLRGLDRPPLCPAQVAPDRCPFGWKPSQHDPMLLIQDPAEQYTIWFLIEAAQNPAWGPRALCRWLDSHGRKRRGGKPWAGAHGLVTAILKRYNAATPAAATLRLQERIAVMRARAS